jgi:mono/diheme cytochrome c family protein
MSLVKLLRAAYVRWIVLLAAAAVAGCAAAERTGPDDDEQLARGQELYEANCMACHGGPTGGDIADIPPPHNAKGHTWHHPECELVAITLAGLPPRPELPEDVAPMPAFRAELSEDDVYDILAYIRTWWTPEQRRHQEQVTEQVCE